MLIYSRKHSPMKNIIFHREAHHSDTMIKNETQIDFLLLEATKNGEKEQR